MKKEIIIQSASIEEKILKNCQALVLAFFPGSSVIIQVADNASAGREDEQEKIVLKIEKTKGDLESLESLQSAELVQPVFQISCKSNGYLYTKEISAPVDKGLTLPGKEPLPQILVKRAMAEFLSVFTGQNNPWGILTGVRPGKLVTKMVELGYNQESQYKILKDYYLLSPSKIRLLQEVNRRQMPLIRHFRDNKNLVAVYVAIPFCPSRCFYCSFPSQSLTSHHRDLLSAYLRVLRQEIKYTAEVLKTKGLKVDSIYIGGGTPTVLNHKDLEGLLSTVIEEIPALEVTEFTVEAGRPDTIDKGKLYLLKQYGVNRLSINPQTMQEKTLKKIGRTHGIEEFRLKYWEARNLSDWVINIDLIIGLPGEGQREILDSIAKVLELRPDNLTVHALALKRGSQAWENNYIHNAGQNWDKIQDVSQEMIFAAGYVPYYLYRQKNIVGNLENVGYCLPGKECRYNIVMIEEICSVIGLGAGAGSKILNMNNMLHENIYNPADVKLYIDRFSEVREHRKFSLI